VKLARCSQLARSFTAPIGERGKCDELQSPSRSGFSRRRTGGVGLAINGTRSVTGWSGNPTSLDPTTLSCFDESWGAAHQNCSWGTACATNSYYWEVGLPVDAVGTYDPTIFFNSQSADAFYCSSNSVSDNGSVYAWTGYVEPSQCSSGVYNACYGSFQPGSVYVPGDGYLFVACYMEPCSYLYDVVY
jgi:hypothetical protein